MKVKMYKYISKLCKNNNNTNYYYEIIRYSIEFIYIIDILIIESNEYAIGWHKKSTR